MSKRKFQNGDLCQIKENAPGNLHSKPGEICTVTAYSSGYGRTGSYRVKSNTTKIEEYVLSIYLEPVTDGKSLQDTTLAKFENDIIRKREFIKKTEGEIAEIQAKIDFVKETGFERFNENEFKAYQTLIIIEQGNLSRIEKAKAIAALIK